MTAEQFRLAEAAFDIEMLEYKHREAISDLFEVEVLDNDTLRCGVTRIRKIEKALEEANERFRQSMCALAAQQLQHASLHLFQTTLS